jgi:hypothetical protein
MAADLAISWGLLKQLNVKAELVQGHSGGQAGNPAPDDRNFTSVQTGFPSFNHVILH